MEYIIYILSEVIYHFNIDFFEAVEDVISTQVDLSTFETLNNYDPIPIELPCNFLESFNQIQNLIKNSDYISQVQSLKALSLFNINRTFGVSNPKLQVFLISKLDLICLLKTNSILIDVISMENNELDKFFFELHHYDLKEDTNAFYHQLSNLDYQAHLVDHTQLLKTDILDDDLFSSPSKLIRRS